MITLSRRLTPLQPESEGREGCVACIRPFRDQVILGTHKHKNRSKPSASRTPRRTLSTSPLLALRIPALCTAFVRLASRAGLRSPTGLLHLRSVPRSGLTCFPVCIPSVSATWLAAIQVSLGVFSFPLIARWLNSSRISVFICSHWFPVCIRFTDKPTLIASATSSRPCNS